MKRALGWSLRIALVVAVLTALVVFLRRPSLERHWDEDVRILAGVGRAPDGSILLTEVRNWSYAEETILSKEYFDASFDPDDIVGMWMYEQQLDRLGWIAHTFVVFEFDESYGPRRYLGLSVETRRESGEEYSIVGGMLRTFEVTHIWATEEDLVRRRVQYLDYPLTRYRLDIAPEAGSEIFEKFAAETAGLAVAPRWYNTALNNCTSSLIRYVNDALPGAIPLHPGYVLTGLVDDHLADLGYLDRGSALHVTRDYLESNSLR